jgi:hypothetical protein
MRGSARRHGCSAGARLLQQPFGAGRPRLLFPCFSKLDSYICTRVRKEAEAADLAPFPQGVASSISHDVAKLSWLLLANAHLLRCRDCKCDLVIRRAHLRCSTLAAEESQMENRDEANVALGTVVKLKAAILITTSICAEPHGCINGLPNLTAISYAAVFDAAWQPRS